MIRLTKTQSFLLMLLSITLAGISFARLNWNNFNSFEQSFDEISLLLPFLISSLLFMILYLKKLKKVD
jgi:hypothetical protein